MTTSAKVAPPNSLVLITDSGGGEIPASMAGSLIAATSSCIAVGCRSESDGETAFTLGFARDVNPSYAPFFEGKLATPNRKIVLRSVIGQTILEQQVSGWETTIQIWVNDTKEPDSVVVGIA